MNDVDWKEMAPERGRQLLEEAAQQFLGMTADEFIAKWDAGQFNGDSTSRRVLRVAGMLPFGRQ